MSCGAGGAWFVRYAGRVTGPFDAERLRTMAARGQLTAVHFLSVDGAAWVPAPQVPGVFPATSGTEVPGGGSERGIGPVDPPVRPDAPVIELTDAHVAAAVPTAAPADAPRLVSGVPIAASAAVLVAIAFVSSGGVSALSEAMQDHSSQAQRLRAALRAFQALSGIFAFAVLALTRSTASSIVMASAAGVLAVLAVVDAGSEVPWAAAAIAPAPACAAFLGIRRISPRGSQPWAVLLVSIGIATGAVAILRAIPSWDALHLDPLACASLAATGCAAAAVAGFVAFRSVSASSDSTFGWAASGVGLGVLAVLAQATIFPSPEAREAAVAACMALGFSGLCWASAPAMARPSPGRA